jgi:GTP1/Obg family GTP-binding protein
MNKAATVCDIEKGHFHKIVERAVMVDRLHEFCRVILDIKSHG